MSDEQLPLISGQSSHAPTTTFTRKTTRIGYLYTLFGGLCFSIAATMTHICESRLSISPATSVFLHTFIYLPLSSLPLLFQSPHRAGSQSLSRAATGWLALRGLLGAVSIALVLFGFKRLPAGDVAAIFFTMPVFVMLFAIPLAGEWPTRAELATASLSLLGAVLIAAGDRADALRAILAGGPPSTAAAAGGGGGSDGAGALSAAGAAGVGAVFAAAGYAVARKLGTSVHFLANTAAIGAWCLPLGLLLGGAGDAARALRAGGAPALALQTGAVGVALLAHVAVHGGLQISRAGAALVVRNVEIPLLYVIGTVLLDEAPGALQVVGATLVVTASVAAAMLKTGGERKIGA